MKTFPIILLLIHVLVSACNIQPRNTLSDCREQCKDSPKSNACYEFCDCIHKEGHPLDECLDEYNEAPEDAIGTP